MDPFWDKYIWLLTGAFISGIAWIAKSIFKPWSDASLMKAAAFVSLVKTLEKSVGELPKQTAQLEAISKSSGDAVTLLSRFPQDPTMICQAHVMKDATLAAVVAENLRQTAAVEASVLAAKAARVATDVTDLAADQASALKARAELMPVA